MTMISKFNYLFSDAGHSEAEKLKEIEIKST